MPYFLDIDTWNRRAHFHFFKQFEEPFFGVTAEVDVTRAYAQAKEKGVSFFVYYLHKSLAAAQQVPAFRYRIDAEGRVVVHDTIHASSTINRADGTFGFSLIHFEADLDRFKAIAQAEIDRVRAATGLELLDSDANVIHYSSLPWIKFTALSHARAFAFKDSIPKISFGKMTSDNNRRVMPVSVHVHHALADGSDVGQFLDVFQQMLDH